MRRLDQALDRLATRSEPMGAELLIAHIERQLAGEPDVVVAQQERRGVMVTTKQRPTHTPPNPPRRRAPAIAFASFVVIALAVLSVWLIAGSDDEGQDVIDQVTTTLPAVTTTSPPAPTTAVEAAGFEPGFGIEKVEQYAAALRADDLSGLVTTDPIFAGSDYSPDFEGWLIGLNLDPQVSDCVEKPGDSVTVTCVMTPGDGFFFSQVSGDLPVTSQLTMRVLPDGTLQGISMPPHGLVVGIERELRDWVRENHPELESRMFGPNIALMTREAGELHMQLLDEYMESR